VNGFDLVVIVIAAGAAIGGYRLGFLARVISWIGLAAGLYVAVRFLPRILRDINPGNSTSRLVVATLVLVGGAFIGQAIGLVAGARLHRILPLGAIREIDRGVGAGIGVLGVLVALWLFVPSLAQTQGWPARETSGSVISRWVSRNFPVPPNAMQVLRRLVGNGAPQVYSALHQTPNTGSIPAANPLSPNVTATVSASTVKVEGQACNRIQEGSGFAVGPNLVATNAHVVAGEPAGQTSVLLRSGRRAPATVVMFDADRDIALLSVPSLSEAPLPVGIGHVGDTGAVFGHPGGIDQLRIMPAAIASDISAVGRDLYDRHDTRRDVFVLAAALAPGDSGGALVGTSGTVVGVAFAIAPDRSGTAYALTSKELSAALIEPRNPSGTATGSCLTE
jgi:S1-C subfamily serine protease